MLVLVMLGGVVPGGVLVVSGSGGRGLVVLFGLSALSLGLVVGFSVAARWGGLAGLGVVGLVVAPSPHGSGMGFVWFLCFFCCWSGFAGWEY